jgi:hypothetical protein
LWNGRAHPVCLNHPDVRAYVCGLFEDLVANYPIDYVQTCMIPFAEGDPSKGGCFCENCVREAKAHGFDLEAARRVLLDNPQAVSETAEWQAFRVASVVRWYEIMHKAAHSIRPQIDFRFNAFMRHGAPWGVDLKAMKPQLDSLRLMEYSEQKGSETAMESKRQWLTEARQMLGPAFPILSAIAVRPKATPALIREGVRIARQCGMDGITLGHYDGAEFPMLRAVREGLNA